MPNEEERPNFYAELRERLPERYREHFDRQLLQVLDRRLAAEDLAREKGRDPVGFLVRRFDFTALPFPVYLRHQTHGFLQSETGCQLEWWPHGERERVEFDDDAEPDFTKMVYASRRTRRVVPEQKRYDFSVSNRLAAESDAAPMLCATFTRLLGHMPRVFSESELMKKLHG
jgi:hypothetical protein